MTQKPSRADWIAIVVCAVFGAFIPLAMVAESAGPIVMSPWSLLWGAAVGGGFAFAATYGLHWRRRLIDARAVKQWTAIEDQVVRTEKVEQLGHTAGGLSESTGARAGQLSETE